MPDEIEIIIQPTGKVAFRVKGVQGRKGLTLTQNIETLLGEIQERKLSPEYFETPILREIKQPFCESLRINIEKANNLLIFKWNNI